MLRRTWVACAGCGVQAARLGRHVKSCKRPSVHALLLPPVRSSIAPLAAQLHTAAAAPCSCCQTSMPLPPKQVHKGWRDDYGEPFGEGDVIGCLIHLPEGGRPFEKGPAGETERSMWREERRRHETLADRHLSVDGSGGQGVLLPGHRPGGLHTAVVYNPHTARQPVLSCTPCAPSPLPADVVRFKGKLYFPEEAAPAQPQPLPGSFVAFTRNGSLQVGLGAQGLEAACLNRGLDCSGCSQPAAWHVGLAAQAGCVAAPMQLRGKHAAVRHPAHGLSSPIPRARRTRGCKRARTTQPSPSSPTGGSSRRQQQCQ